MNETQQPQEQRYPLLSVCAFFSFLFFFSFFFLGGGGGGVVFIVFFAVFLVFSCPFSVFLVCPNNGMAASVLDF